MYSHGIAARVQIFDERMNMLWRENPGLFYLP